MKKILRTFLLFFSLIAFASCGSATLAHKKDESDIHYRLGVVHLNENNITEALKELTTAIEIYPDEPVYHNALGLAYFARSMNEEAKRSIKKAIDLKPEFSEAHVALSAVYMVERRWDAVIAETREALKNIFYRTPEFAWYNMGQAYQGKGDYTQAVESFKKAVEMNKGYAPAYYSMGQGYEKLGMMKESAEAYRGAINAAPGYVDAHFSLGLVLVKEKDRKGALKSFEKVVEMAPGSDKAKSAKEYINLIK